MKYKNTTVATFLSRPNRFIGIVDIEGKEHTVHIKNTGRCKELLKPNNLVILEKSQNTLRKTQYDLVSVYKSNDILINMDSQLPNQLVYDFLPRSGLFTDGANVRREVTYGSSRFDIYVEDGERKAFIEVKGVTLEQDGKCYFPDAPTERGIKHLNELINSISDGYEAYVIFVIQFKNAKSLSPNDKTHPAFGNALREAYKRGVKLLAYDCIVEEDFVEINNKINIIL